MILKGILVKYIIDVDKYEQLKLAASKLAESEKIIKEHLKIKAVLHHQYQTHVILGKEREESNSPTFRK